MSEVGTLAKFLEGLGFLRKCLCEFVENIAVTGTALFDVSLRVFADFGDPVLLYFQAFLIFDVVEFSDGIRNVSVDVMLALQPPLIDPRTDLLVHVVWLLLCSSRLVLPPALSRDFADLVIAKPSIRGQRDVLLSFAVESRHVIPLAVGCRFWFAHLRPLQLSTYVSATDDSRSVYRVSTAAGIWTNAAA